MRLFRAHIKPTAGKGSPKVSFEYCLKEKVIGIGWQAGDSQSIKNWDEYYAEMSDFWSNRSFKVVAFIKNNIRKSDLIWTRNNKGEYYLCKVLSGWEYYATDEAIEADIVNIVRCNFVRIPYVDEVPGKVLANFRATLTIQSVWDNTSVEYSKHLWNKYSDIDHFDDFEDNAKNIFSLLNSEETEDVIFIYLQVLGWVVIPNSRKGDTMKYEFYLINRETKEKAIVQVKTGNTPLNPTDEIWEKNNEKVYLFQSNGIYTSESQNDSVICIKPEDIEMFMRDNKYLLPANISHWLDV